MSGIIALPAGCDYDAGTYLGPAMKKIQLLCFLAASFFCTSVFAWASPYLGGRLDIETLTTEDSNFRGLRPNVSLGYAVESNFYYLGMEAFAAPFVYTFATYHAEGGNSLRISQQYGAGILPGLLISEGVVTYLRLGVVTSKFLAPSMNRWGFQGGLGLQTSLTGALSLRGEYTYSDYGSVSDDGSDLGLIKADQFSVGLIYFFDI